MMGYYGHGMMSYGNYYGYGHGMMGYGGHGYGMMSSGWSWIMMLGIIVLSTLAVIAFIRYIQRSSHSSPVAEGNIAVQILDERYARGEIADEEYKKKKFELKS